VGKAKRAHHLFPNKHADELVGTLRFAHPTAPLSG